MCTGEPYRQHLNLTFPKAAAFKGPGKISNAELGVTGYRDIDIRGNDRLDDAAFRALLREAPACNRYHPRNLVGVA